jgi:FkbM family methyltransferase
MNVLNTFTPYEIFVDVGAFLGWYSELALQEGITTVAFEPNVQSFNMLFKNLSKYNALPITINKAVSNTNGLTNFYNASRLQVSSLNEQWLISKNRSTYKKTQIETVTLDSFFEHMTKLNIGMLKIDAEGSEIDIINGAMQLIKSGRIRNMLIEKNEGEQEMFYMLSEYYNMFQVLPKQLIEKITLRDIRNVGNFDNGHNILLTRKVN